MYEVTSEIYKETDFKPVVCENGQIISKFSFVYPVQKSKKMESTLDNDGDLLVARKIKGVIELEHSTSTALALVGLQVWRGALLLADFIFYNREEFSGKHVLELGAGVGLTSIATAIYCEKVICTDVDVGGILRLIRGNVSRNSGLLKNNIEVIELDFKKSFTSEVTKIVDQIDLVIAADVIYDDDLTEVFISVLDKLLNKNFEKRKTIFVALEKRYVFTLSDLETVAPCYEHFTRKVKDKSWTIKEIPIDFPQYFEYERCKELILLKITN